MKTRESLCPPAQKPKPTVFHPWSARPCPRLVSVRVCPAPRSRQGAGWEPCDSGEAEFSQVNLTVFTSTPRDKHFHFPDNESEAQKLSGMPKATQYGTGLGTAGPLSLIPLTEDGYCASGSWHQQPPGPHPQAGGWLKHQGSEQREQGPAGCGTWLPPFLSMVVSFPSQLTRAIP